MARFRADDSSRLGEAEAKRRENLRNAENQAKADGKGVWSEQPETVRPFSAYTSHGVTSSNALGRCPQSGDLNQADTSATHRQLPDAFRRPGVHSGAKGRGD